MKKGYHKRVDRSMMDWGLTIPNDFINDFLSGEYISPGESSERILI
jgi:hypothetical protein